VIFLIILAGPSLASAYTAEQQTLLDGMRLSFQLGIAYQQAQQGQNIEAFNTLVDQYNDWVRLHFGEDPDLIMEKMIIPTDASLNAPSSLAVPPDLVGIVQRRPFNTSSDLSQFGKQQVLTQIPPESQGIAEANIADWVLKSF
jgi:hypothetical protein